MQIDVLRSVLNNVFAVNCEVKDSTLHCGALYLFPRIPTAIIRFTHEGGSLDVELPSELLNQAEATRAWSIDLPICHEQVRNPSVRR